MTDANQVRDSTGKVLNPGQNDPNHWQSYHSTSGVIKAEESGKVVVLTDIVLHGHTAAQTNAGNIRNKDGSGALLMYIGFYGIGTITKTFREGLEGAAYDGSNAGDLYWTEGGDPTVLFTGYMRDA